jgi:hypothetical protein
LLLEVITIVLVYSGKFKNKRGEDNREYIKEVNEEYVSVKIQNLRPID